MCTKKCITINNFQGCPNMSYDWSIVCWRCLLSAPDIYFFIFFQGFKLCIAHSSSVTWNQIHRGLVKKFTSFIFIENFLSVEDRGLLPYRANWLCTTYQGLGCDTTLFLEPLHLFSSFSVLSLSLSLSLAQLDLSVSLIGFIFPPAVSLSVLCMYSLCVFVLSHVEPIDFAGWMGHTMYYSPFTIVTFAFLFIDARAQRQRTQQHTHTWPTNTKRKFNQQQNSCVSCSKPNNSLWMQMQLQHLLQMQNM